MATPPVLTGHALLIDVDADTVTGSTGDLVSAVTGGGTGAVSWAQSTTAFKPSLRVAGLGGHNALRFDGADDRLQATFTWPGTYSIFVVSIPSSASSTSAGEVAGDQAGSNPRIFQVRRTAGIVFNSAGGNAATASPSVGTFDVPRLFGIVRDTATAWAHRDGEATTTTAIAGTPASGTRTIGIGQASTSGQYMPTDIARVLVFDGVVTGADFVRVCSWVQDTYGITVSNYQPDAPPPAITGFIVASAPAARVEMAGEVVPLGPIVTLTRNAAAATSATRPTLAQRIAATAKTARAATTATLGRLTHHTPTTTRAAASATTASRPLASHRTATATKGVAATATATRPLLSQRIATALRSAQAATTATRPLPAIGGAVRTLAAWAATTATRPLPTHRTPTTVRDATAAATATRPTLGQRIVTLVRGAVAATTADRVNPGEPEQLGPCPPERLLVVPPEQRVFTVPAEQRVFTVPPEKRIFIA